MLAAAAGQPTWTSAHIFLDEGSVFQENGDRVVLDVIAPLINEWRRNRAIDRYFFVRYTEEGHHIRLRIRVNDGSLATGVRRVLTEFMERSPGVSLSPSASLTVQQYEPEGPTFTYEPELDRYGGSAALDVGERVFEASSDLAVAILRTLKPGRGSRVGRAIPPALAMLHTFCGREDAKAIAKRYCSEFLERPTPHDLTSPCIDQLITANAHLVAHVIPETWLVLDRGEGLTGALAAFRALLATHRVELERLVTERRVFRGGQPLDDWRLCAWYLVPSQVHMMNNRLGLGRIEEALVARLIADAL